jgi:uncharacterized protein YecE (DUF72 family)
LDRDLKPVLEFRHRFWMNEAVVALLRQYRAGFCIFDMPGLASPLVATTDFAYIRFHGMGSLYSGSYPEGKLSALAGNIRNLSSWGKTLYIYFNNDACGYVNQNARTLQGYLKSGAK